MVGAAVRPATISRLRGSYASEPSPDCVRRVSMTERSKFDATMELFEAKLTHA
jgi:hypothetical protein